MKEKTKMQSLFPTMGRRAASLLALTAALTGAAATAESASPAGKTAVDPLLFPKDNFTLETKTVKSASGERKIVYRSYQHILYVAHPVDKEYQSLNVQEPVEIDGRKVDAAHAPILFVVAIGGYMSSNNYHPRGPGGRMGAGPGGPGGTPFRGAPGTMGPNGAADLALAAGYVVVTPGARGRDNQAADGSYYGKAPAAVVDLKAAVRYIRHNTGLLPGNPNWIVSSGCSAGGAISAALGASGDSPLYEPYLKEIGAAEGRDAIFASGCNSPVTDLEHADTSYEWAFGGSKTRSGAEIDAAVSDELKRQFTAYEASLQLQGKDGFGPITAETMDAYLVKEYFAPAAKSYLLGLSEEKRREYLEKNPWLKWDGATARFTYREMAAQHIVRMKTPPAFDGFTQQTPENSEFGDRTINARHFTLYSLRKATAQTTATLDPELEKVVKLMNPMYFTGIRNPGAAQHWWIRHGAIETDSAPTNTVNLALSLEKMGRDVNAGVFWEAGHCQEQDPEGFIRWIGAITGYGK